MRQEQFLTDKERGDDGEFGPEWGQVEEREEENFYFRLAASIDQSSGCSISSTHAAPPGSPLVVPDFRVAELRNAVEKLEGDLCISRPAVAAPVGHPVSREFGAGFVTYVWFDALVNYISFAPGHDPHFASDAATRTNRLRRRVLRATGGRRCTSSARTSSSPRTASIGRSC